ncbi:MAG: site-2 protease family protein [Catenulisporales bacterium]|nr:site-2 protease family protein [Catenulisporales bacterium]
MTLWGWLLFAFALIASIMLHEAGHMTFARKAGGKVTEFFVGFGPKIWSFRKGETEYGVKAIPAGGYVKIVGMTDLEPIEPEDEPRAFYTKPLGWRLLTLAAGSLVHFAIALVLFMMVPMFWGDSSYPAKVGAVSSCLKTAAGDCTAADPQSPAAQAGLGKGDQLVAVNNTPVKSWSDVTDALHKGQPTLDANGKPAGAPLPVTITFVHDGVQTTKTITPEVGNQLKDTSQYQAGLMIGIQAPDRVTKDVSVPAAIGQGFTDWGSNAKASLQGLVDIPKSIPKLFQKQATSGGGSAPATDRPVGVIGMGNLTGDLIKQSGYATFLSFIASINLFIGIFNLLPLLPLDGGHIAIALYEGARRKIADLRRRPDPGRVDLNKLMPAAFTFLVLFVGLSLLLMAADITNPLKFPS